MQSKPYSKTHISASYFGRCSVEFAAATSVVAMNGVDVVAHTTLFAGRLIKIGQPVGCIDSRQGGWSVSGPHERFAREIIVRASNLMHVL